MSDALDRLAPEDKKGGSLYRHSAEGRDDMPVRILFDLPMSRIYFMEVESEGEERGKRWLIH